MQKEIVEFEIPKPSAPYSYAVKCGDFIFTAGIMSIDLKNGNPLPGEIGFQTKQALENMKSILQSCGIPLENVVKTTVFLKSFDDYAKMNKIYELYFPKNPPARSTVEVSRLAGNLSVEIEAVGVISK